MSWLSTCVDLFCASHNFEVTCNESASEHCQCKCHNHRYVMVYSEIPHMEMCSDGSMIVSDDAPGNMPAAGAFLPDPYPLWKPPLPDSTPKEGKVGASTALGSHCTGHCM